MMRPRRIRFVTLLVVLAVIGIAFAVTNRQIQENIQRMTRQESQDRIRLSGLQSEKLKLEAEISAADTDEYIENQARTRYGYLKPGELRFVITNPETLYTSGVESPQLQVVQEGDEP